MAYIYTCTFIHEKYTFIHGEYLYIYTRKVYIYTRQVPIHLYMKSIHLYTQVPIHQYTVRIQRISVMLSTSHITLEHCPINISLARSLPQYKITRNSNFRVIQ